MRTGRRALALATGLLAAGGLVAHLTVPPPLGDAVLDFVAASQRGSGGTYVAPSQQARDDLARAVVAAAAGREGEAAPLLARHGYRQDRVEDGQLLLPDEVPDGRGWGLYAVRPEGTAVAVEVPHPRADRYTENLGGELAERLHARYLLVAGARRDRSDGDADVAHRASSVFAAVHAALAAQGVPALQVHGFATESSPGRDVVVSPGSAAVSPLVERVADAVEATGLRTCRAWREDCGRLEGRTNAQAAASTRAGAEFVHLEVAAPVRADTSRRAALVDALVSVLGGS